MFTRVCLFTATILCAAMMSGCCCGPCGGFGGGGYGGGCVTNCNSCDGVNYGGGCNVGPYTPFQSLNSWRKSLVCGGGCGEVYYDEWQSTPPDSRDPCSRGEFTGGRVPCNPFCWRPGMFFGFLGGLCSQRCYGGYGGYGGCGGCGGGGGCGCDGGGYVDSGYVDGGYVDGGYSGGGYSGGGGCSTCNASASYPSNTRVSAPTHATNPNIERRAQTPPPNARTARVNQIRHGVSSSHRQSDTRYR